MRVKKKGQAGQAKNFITRTQAVRKLQISLPDFRRLCIFKGIYPREPRNKKKASKTAGHNTTFYYSKDIQYLLHEPLLAKFREHRAVSKKIARSLGKNEVGDAARLDKAYSKRLSLDHIIKERYPTFVDAVRDLDDALSLLFLFASLPSNINVPPKTIALCQRLCHEFQHYLITSHSLRRSFISIKGIYYQATIQGQDVLWLVPHKFVQRVTGDVDFRIMATFVEFYTTLLGFVNYRLYSTIGLVYPPKLDVKADELGAELNAFRLEGRGLNGTTQSKALTEGEDANEVAAEVDPAIQKDVEQFADARPDAVEQAQDPAATGLERSDVIDTFEAAGKDADILEQPAIDNSSAGVLFSEFTFFLNRETPRAPLEFLLRAFGSKRVGWEATHGSGAFTHDESDPSITHQVVDRPPVMIPEGEEEQDVERPKTFAYGYRVPGRTYVQPQWVWDCVNQGRLLRPDLYAPGATLPPHLSPFVKAKPGQYDPTKSLAEQEREGEVAEFEEAEAEAAALEAGEESEDDPVVSDDDPEDDEDLENGMQIADDQDDEEESDDASEDGSFGGFEGDEDLEMDDAQRQQTVEQLELQAEAEGLSIEDVAAKKGLKGILKKTTGNEIRKKAEQKRRREQEEKDRLVGMLPNKKKKLYKKMEYGINKNESEAEALRTKRRKIEKAKTNV